jgi:RNA polymerase sigma-54 factor
MKLGLSLKFSQNLSLTPQLQQAIKLLQLSHHELQDELLAQVEENPFLSWEASHSHPSIAANGAIVISAPLMAQGMQAQPLNATETRNAPDEALNFDERSSDFDLNTRSATAKDNNGDDSEGDYLGWVQADATTLREHLHSQARLVRGDPVVIGVLGLLIEALTPEGYFEQDLAGLTDTLAQHCDVPNDFELNHAISQALSQLHRLDPPGVGAFDLQQCLLLQLQHICAADCVLDAKTSTHTLALRVLTEGFDCLAQRDRATLKKRLKYDDTLLDAAIKLIRALDPKPGWVFSPPATEYALPEVLVIKNGDEWQARLNPAVVPPLRVADTHAKFIKNKHATPEVAAVHATLHGQLQNAKQLVRTVQQHFDTVFRVGQAIVAAQQDFFSFGAKKIKPMVLRDIADTLGLHESTISRVTTKKYLQTPHGVLEMKYFFSSSLANDSADSDLGTSSTAIKAHLQPLIQGEPPHKPLSDQALTDALAALGHIVARRTIAKYREQLGYPPAHARKPF